MALEKSLGAIGILFLLLAVERVFALPLHRLGIVPRTWSGLGGIVFSPLLHANLSHLAANAVPLFVLLLLLLSHREYRPWRTLAMIWLASGAGTWLIGRGHAIHLGASSIIFGVAAFLIVAGWRLRSWHAVAVSVSVVVFYGGIFYGVLPRSGPISWEGHLCGMIAGVLAARGLRQP
jgi:membrane associated rhomboid family serine protease